MKNKIPDRWLDYTPMGTKVAGTRFIAFKVPLSKEICNKLKPSERFTPEILMERCPSIRLIIDLTNTDRYYNKQEFIDRGVQYEKIMCPGHIIPPQSLIFRFFEIIDDFYLKNGLKNVLIGIHCTHGVNRTGYFIGRYMVQRMGFHFEKAIPCIEEARGHKIERENYVKDLKTQIPIPSSLSGKKDFKPISKKISSTIYAEKMGAEKKVTRNSDVDSNVKLQHRSRSPIRGIRDLPPRSDREKISGQNIDKHFSHFKRDTSPLRRESPRRQSVPQGKRIPSPQDRRGGRRISRSRTPPRPFSPSRNRSPLRRPSPRRMSPRRDTSYGPPFFRSFDDDDTPPIREISPRRSETYNRLIDPYLKKGSPPRSTEYHRGHQERQNFNRPSDEAIRSSYETERGHRQQQNVPPSKYRPPTIFTDARPHDRNVWDDRSNRAQSFNEDRTAMSNFNIPPTSDDPRQGSGLSHASPWSKEDIKREDSRKAWNEDKSRPTIGGGRYEDNKGFQERNDFRPGPNKYGKSFQSSPHNDYSRDKRSPSSLRNSRDEMVSFNQPSHGYEPERGSWDNRRHSPDQSQYREFPKERERKPKSPTRRPGSPVRKRSRSPRRSNQAGFEDIERKRTPPRNRSSHGPNYPPKPFSPSMHGEVLPQTGMEPCYRDNRYNDLLNDCRDLINQKRQFESTELQGEHKKGKFDIKDLPKEVDLRRVIKGNNNNEPLLKDRLGPHPRDDRLTQTSRDGRFLHPNKEEHFKPAFHNEKFSGPSARDSRFGGIPPTKSGRFDGSSREEPFEALPREEFFGRPPRDERFDGQPSRGEHFIGPPSRDDRFGGPSHREQRFGGPTIKEDRHNVPSMREDRFANPPVREHFSGPPTEERFSGPPRDNRFSGPPRDNRFSGPPRDNRFNRPPRKDERLGQPPRDHSAAHPTKERFGGSQLKREALVGSPPRVDRFSGPSKDDPFNNRISNNNARFGGLIERDARFSETSFKNDRSGGLVSKVERFDGPSFRDEPLNQARRIGRGRSRSPRRGSPPRYGGGPPRRY